MNARDQPLLEREREIGAIDEQLTDACAGSGSLLVIEGPAGIGKTALLRAPMDMGGELGMTSSTGAEASSSSRSTMA